MMRDDTAGVPVLATASRAVIGVSLSNTRFNGSLVELVASVVADRNLHALEVLIFDQIERINYRVFRAEELDAASRLAAHRGREIAAMFEKRLRRHAGVSVQCTLESGSVTRRSGRFARNRELVYASFARRGRFYEDVKEQTRLNLAARRARHGEEFVDKHLEELCCYVLDEVAFFAAFYEESCAPCAEFYPGPILFVRPRVWNGMYATEGLMMAGRPSEFVDLTDVHPLRDSGVRRVA